MAVYAQTSTIATFDVVSIKRSSSDAAGGSARTTPDGTTTIVNQPLRFVLTRGVTEPIREVENLPAWATERYDVTVKPPAGASRQSVPEMWRNMLAERFKFQAHVERREKDGFALVLARKDGRLGPGLKPSTLDCTPTPRAGSPPQPISFPTRQEAAARCGMLAGQGFIVSGGMTMERLAPLLAGQSPVVDRTGLTGFYSVELTFAPTRPAAQAEPVDPAAPPDVFTAIQDQLGLKLQREKITIAVLVIDHIERPTEN